ncbi:hemolysin family protein [Massilia sp. TS11]|uniref:hemolysin family protein n=1 Tax=Massilia sp. TS11 TaxID=2908003 RepID=UPI001EDAF77A|nr:hemolysin family protein [Massilia sp. TS11]MCG2585349.1 hemolysin family protein [Massilia sp. TS11]
MENLLLVILALVLVALNGFFVAAEFGIVTLRPTRVRAIARRGGWRGRILANVHGQLDAYLSACQLGITLASLGLGWVGEPAFAGLLEPLFAALGLRDPEWIHGLSFAIAFGVISFLHIVVGELAPKSLAIRLPERVAIGAAVPLYGFYWLMYPAIWLLNASANATLRLAGLGAPEGHDGGHGSPHYSNEELKLILRSSQPGQTGPERQVLLQALDFSQRTAADLMRPMNEVIGLSAACTREENLATMVRNRFSRYPYLDASGEQVLGLIHVKDLFLAQRPPEDLAAFLRPVETFPARTPAQEVFRHFRAGAPHFALVGEKGKRPIGFLTLDNLLGALVGEIHDEFRLNENDWLPQADGSLVGKASLPLVSLERALGIELGPEESGGGEVESVGGLLMLRLGDVPSQGQRVRFAHFDVVVRKMKGPRIMLVKVIPHRPDEQ